MPNRRPRQRLKVIPRRLKTQPNLRILDPTTFPNKRCVANDCKVFVKPHTNTRLDRSLHHENQGIDREIWSVDREIAGEDKREQTLATATLVSAAVGMTPGATTAIGAMTIRTAMSVDIRCRSLALEDMEVELTLTLETVKSL